MEALKVVFVFLALYFVISCWVMPLLSQLCCLFGFHGWKTNKLKRKCVTCGKREVWVRVGKESGWK